MTRGNEVLTRLPIDQKSLKLVSPCARVNIEDFFSQLSVNQSDIVEIRGSIDKNVDVVQFSNKEVVSRINDIFLTRDVKIKDIPVVVRPIYECNLPIDQEGNVLNRLFIPYIPKYIHQVDLKNIFNKYGEIYSLTYAPPIALIDFESVFIATSTMNTENSRKQTSERKIKYAKDKTGEKKIIFDPEKIIVKFKEKDTKNYMLLNEFKKFGNITSIFHKNDNNFAIISFEELASAYRALNEYDGRFEIHACIAKRPLITTDKQYNNKDESYSLRTEFTVKDFQKK